MAEKKLNLIYLEISTRVPFYLNSVSQSEKIKNLIEKIQKNGDMENGLFLAICHQEELEGLLHFFKKRYQQKNLSKKMVGKNVRMVDTLYLTRNLEGNLLTIGKIDAEITIAEVNNQIMWPLTGSFLAICPHRETGKLVQYFKEKYWNWEIKKTVKNKI
jgi:hypothetical protein